MEELNALISPCKKLRLDSPEDNTVSDSLTNLDTQLEEVRKNESCVMAEIEEESGNTNVEEMTEQDCGEEFSDMNSVYDNVILETNVNNAEEAGQCYSSKATAMLVKSELSGTVDDSNEYSKENEHNGQTESSNEYLDTIVELVDHDMKSMGGVSNNAVGNPTNDSDMIKSEEAEVTELLQKRQDEIKQLCCGVKVSDIIKQMEACRSKKTDVKNLEVVTVETENDPIERNSECLKTVDVNTTDLSELDLRENHSESLNNNRQKGNEINEPDVMEEVCSECLDLTGADHNEVEVNEPGMVEGSCSEPLELKATVLNKSDSNKLHEFDVVEDGYPERLEISGASDCDKDIEADKKDHLINVSSSFHVYANVIVNCPNSSLCKEDQKKNQTEGIIGKTQVVSGNVVAICDEVRRTSGDGAEVLEETGKYFSVVDDDNSDSDIGADGVEVEEETMNYFCTFEGNKNFINSHHLYDIKEEKYYPEITVESSLAATHRLNYTEVDVTMVTNNRNADPLCSSTPMASSGKIVDTANRNAENTFSTFKPSTVTKSEISRKSQPLLTSTPLLKPYQGLKVRDMNIMHVGLDDKPGIERKLHDVEVEHAKDNNVDAHTDVVQETDSLKRSNKIVRRHSFQDETLDMIRASKREKRRNKGVRKEKFKEYMGPGLTVGMSSEDVSSVSKKDFVKNSDIETCTLVEYKGFGLTGPLPDRPLHASTPVPPAVDEEGNKDNALQNHFGQISKITNDQVKAGHCLSGLSLGGRPAGTEGMLIHTIKPENQKLRQTVSETRFGQKLVSGPSDLRLKTLTRHNSDLGPGGHSKQNRLTGWLATVQAHRPHAVLPVLSEGQVSAPGTSVPLKPDEVYPGVNPVGVVPVAAGCGSVGGSSKTEKSESNSNADKSDKSDKVQVIDSAVLQSQGQLKVSAYMNFGLLTVHVIQGRQLSTKYKNTCDSFVKLSLLPDDGKKPKCRTEVVQDSNNPLYDEKLSFELNEEDHNKRLMISVWHRDTSASVNEFLGCMSFGIRHLTNPKKDVNGWYYLLTEDIGRKKHLQVSHRQRPHLKVRNHANIPSVNKDVWGTESLTLTLHRGKNGFGFSVIEACPVRVGRVDGTSPAEAAGLQPGDIIVRLNKQNVSRSTATSVAKLIKHSSNTMVIELHRPRPVTYEQLENTVCLSNTNQTTRNNLFNYDNELTTRDTRDHTVPQMYTINDDDDDDDDNNKENIMIDDETLYPLNPHIASLATSTPLPLLARGHRTVQTCEIRKQEAIHRLLSLELDFIDIMHSGMQRYSRPLRHCILSHSQHAALFQNIEKLVTISEYHVKQMHDNAPSSFVSEDDTDTSGNSENHNFIQSIGLIYQSKVHMLCQAYDLYAKGITVANQVLSELRRSEDFVRFVRDPPLEGSQPSISTFIYRPVQHVKELCKVVHDVFSNTSTDSPDYNSLKQVVEGLQECSTNITNYSCERVESLTSLTSRDSKVSFTSSMKSKSSTSCSSSSSKGQGHLLQSSKAVDLQVMKIQDRLIFPSNVPVFQLCQDDRHLIFSGDMFKWEGRQWIKVHIYLFTDMILQTVQEPDGYLRVIQEPTFLQDISAMDAQRQHGTEFVLYCCARLSESGHSGKRKLSFRAPSTEQKMAWKSLVEQRVFAVRGTMDYYSSTSDMSSSSASAIVI